MPLQKHSIDFLSDEEIKQYEFAEKQIEILEQKKQTINNEIDFLRKGIYDMNHEINKRLMAYMLSPKRKEDLEKMEAEKVLLITDENSTVV